jgi:hypothetical protein
MVSPGLPTAFLTIRSSFHNRVVKLVYNPNVKTTHMD